MYLHIIYFLKIIIFFSAIIFIGPRKESIKNYEIENKYITNNLYISENDNDTTYLYTIIASDIRKIKFLEYSSSTSKRNNSNKALKTKKRRLRTG